MYFDDPIYLDRSSFEDLMVDTDQHRICWMYHDILSHPRIAWMFDKYAGKGTPIREAWTTMAWVAPATRRTAFIFCLNGMRISSIPPSAATSTSSNGRRGRRGGAGAFPQPGFSE